MWSGWRYGNSRKREEFSNYVHYRTSFFGILGTYDITEEARKEAMNAEHESEVPSIYRSNIAAKIAYEHFVGERKWR